jgi:hypothetical protein
LIVPDTTQTIPANATALAFYSCCNNKPHRFQFILLDNYTKEAVSRDENNVIINNNNQYFCEIVNPDS